ncbi:hypothetical protein G3I40_33090 [Streptomyces sp. SID14478]|uniref:hypothetical protein n=1 Tax=Streptomyces sp. SID14478 TaxID=2706073 RepID=UPI0013DA7C7B|nr:hypothetical protein [Streptomyces sp. SID14478]NEB80017.1 hypothetical protein [Streptomyces sp. SID14478]
MALRLLCKDPESPDNNSPTLYYDEERKTFLLQSWKIDDPERLASIEVPDHETVVEFPTRLLKLFPDAASWPQ